MVWDVKVGGCCYNIDICMSLGVMMVTTVAKSDKNHVIIIGGGHVGLSFALLLAHQGIYSTLIESVVYPSVAPDSQINRQYYLDSRNTALSRRTVQIYQEIGLWPQLQSHACRIDKVSISELGSFGRATLDKHAENVESFGQVMENAWLGRQLLQAVLKSKFVTLIQGASVVDIYQDDNQATVTIKHLNQEYQTMLTAPLVVACDGQHSVSRQILGVSVQTHDYEQIGIVGVVQTDKPHHHVAIEKFSSVGPLALLPLPDIDDESGVCHQRSVVFICPKGQESRYLTDDAYFLEALHKVFGDEAGQFIKAGRRGAYPLMRVLAQKQVVGRCVIMGNAAHTLHPVAGQGFNLCLRDAYSLANMLGETWHNATHGVFDFGHLAKLKQYERSRQKDQQRVIKFCDTVVGSFTHKSAVMRFARNVGLLAFDKVPGIKPMVASYAMGLKS